MEANGARGATLPCVGPDASVEAYGAERAMLPWAGVSALSLIAGG